MKPQTVLQPELIIAETNAWLEAHFQELVDHLGQLVSCNSVFPNELPIQRDHIEPFLQQELTLDRVARVNVCQEAERPFVVGVWQGRGAGPTLLLNGHIDTIGAPGSMLARWSTDPWEPVIRDGKLYGRGSNDMKGGVVAMLWAIKALQAVGIEPEGTVLLEIVAGEETQRADIGTVAATRWLQRMGHEIPFAVVTEPTHLEIHTRGMGLYDFDIQIEGLEIHTSMRNLTLFPQRYGIPQGAEVGVDAIARLTRILLLLEDLERQWAMRWRHPHHGGGGYPVHEDVQGVGIATINRTFVSAGTYEGAIPGFARVQGMISYPSWVAGSEVRAEFEQRIATYALLDDWLREHPPQVQVGGVYDWPPFQTDADHPGPQTLARALRSATQHQAIFTGSKYVSDPTFLQRDCGVPAVVNFGPGDPSMGTHGPNEYVPLDQVLDCARALAALIVLWCGVHTR